MPHLVAFNNTGQIVAEVLEPRRYACFLYNAGHFIDVTPSAAPFCQPTSLSDVNPKTGAFSIVGNTKWRFSEFVVGFAAIVSPQALSFHQYVEYPSRLFGVNSSGAITGIYTNEGSQPDGVDPYALPLSTTTTSTDLKLVQFTCPAGCFSSTQSNTAFHSGQLNDAGLVLGLDLRTTQLSIYKAGQPASPRVLAETPSQVDSEDINNADQVAFGYSASGSQTDGRVYRCARDQKANRSADDSRQQLHELSVVKP